MATDRYHLKPLAATTVKPEKGEWVRYGDGWVPKDHPLALEAAKQASQQVSTAPTPAPAIPGMAGATTSSDYGAGAATLAPEPVSTSSTSRPDTTSTDALQGSRGTIGTAWMSNTPTGSRPRQSLAALKNRAY